MGHRRRLGLTFPGYAYELLCTSLGIVGPNYCPRSKPAWRRVVRGRLRAWQKRQDRVHGGEA